MIDTLIAMFRLVILWVGRALGAPASRIGILVFFSTLVVAILYRADRIEAALFQDYPIQAQLLQPVAVAVLFASLGVSAFLLYPDLRAALSPTYRFRRMALDVDSLAESLSNQLDHDNALQGASSPFPLMLENEVAAIKGQLEKLDIRSPPISELEAWNDYLPLLRAWVASGDLRTARWFHPGTTVIVDYR